ncbi:MAG: citrate transporter [Clostridia bacterium]|nr:citrate transporter [Clostridia bacterium]
MQALRFFKKHTVLCVATLAALATCCIVPPSAEYLGYFDFKTLTCLFLTLAVVCALRNIKFFTILARRIVMLTGNLRMLSLALIYITFIGSMLIANDMALITFLPLGYFALSVTKKEKHMAYIFILQNISANLGGMLTPFGNPQNLYLYTAYEIPTGEFMGIMLPPFLLAVAMLTVCCLVLKPEPLAIEEAFPEKLNKPRTVLYLVLFALSILLVFRVFPYWIGLLVIPVILFFADRDALKAVDYPLLLTFVMFFIFSGNMARIDLVRDVLSALLEKSTLLISILSCQVISNVPSAILLSQFTENYRELLLGVNIGGTGTLIASLASLITFSEYKLLHPGDGKHYFLLFTLLNLLFLAVLTAAAYFIFL